MRTPILLLVVFVSLPFLVATQFAYGQFNGHLMPVISLLLDSEPTPLPCSFAPPTENLTFVTAPHGFSNATLTSADPKSTSGGTCVVWVDQQNLDGSPTDFSPDSNESFATRDIFLLNTNTGALTRVTDPNSANLNSNSNVEAASPSISDDGLMIAYVQERTTTASGANSVSFGDVFVRDMGAPNSMPVKVNIAISGSSANAGTPISNDVRGGMAGSRANESLQVVDISGDGQKVAFITREPLSPNDNNATNDVYLRDIEADTTVLVSALNGVAGGLVGTYVRASRNGRYVAFSSATDFTIGEFSVSNPADSPDIYLVDTVTGSVLLITGQAPGLVGAFDMSSDGSRIVFASTEAIASGDTNQLSDIYIADINLSNFTVASRKRVSKAEGQFQVIDDDSYAPTISHSGKRVAFVSKARDLAPYRLNYLSGQEQLYIVDVATSEMSQPDKPSAVALGASLNTHLALSDSVFYYREVVDAGTGSPDSSDAISKGVAVNVASRADIGSIEVVPFRSIRGSIDSASDVDIYRIEGGSSADPLEVAVMGVDSSSGTLNDPMVRVLGMSGNNFTPVLNIDGGLAIGDDSGFGRDAFTTFQNAVSSDRFIEVSSTDGSTGSYRLQIAGLGDISF